MEGGIDWIEAEVTWVRIRDSGLGLAVESCDPNFMFHRRVRLFLTARTVFLLLFHWLQRCRG